MKNKKIISEQNSPQTIDLTQSVKLGCFDTYKVWFDIDPGNQPKKTNSGKSVVTGKNKKGEAIFFYDNGIVKNQVTKGQKRWSCSQTDSMSQSQTKNSDVLTLFSLTPADTSKAKQITKILQGLVDRGAVSDVFVKWNDLLKNVFRDTTLLTLNDTDNALPLNKEDLQIKFGMDMKDKLKQQYGWNNISLYLPTGNVSQATSVDIKLDTDTCNQILSTYVQSAFQYQYQNIQPRPDRIQMQQQINTCYGGGQFNSFKGFPQNVVAADGTQKPFLSIPENKNPFGFFRKSLNFNFIRKLLIGKTDYIAERNPYAFSIGNVQNESKERALKSLIRENLLELSEIKKKNNLSESNIIKTRGNILIENRLVKTKEQQEKFFGEILSEAIYLNSQGFDRNLINEGFWDTITGFFSQHGADSIGATFKEYLTRSIVTWFGGDPNSWISEAVIVAVGNIPLSDYGKLTDCNYLTKILSKTISETAITKIQHDKGMTGGIWDTIRNGLVDALDESTFAQKIEGHLVQSICPKLNSVKEKLETKANDMKQKALS
jgi:hypothetical protein